MKLQLPRPHGASEHVSAYCFSLPNSFTVTVYTAESDLALWAKYVCTYKDFDSSLVSCSHNFEHNQQLFSAKQLYKVQSPTCSTARPQSDTDRRIPARNTEETNDLEETKPGGKTVTAGPAWQTRQSETWLSGNAGCVKKQLVYLKGHICNCCVDNKQISCGRVEDKLTLTTAPPNMFTGTVFRSRHCFLLSILAARELFLDEDTQIGNLEQRSILPAAEHYTSHFDTGLWNHIKITSQPEWRDDYSKQSLKRAYPRM